jgi:hypothetical protein
LEDETAGDTVQEIRLAVERLSHSIPESGGSKAATAAMANLAEGIQGLVQHMRSEQQMVRDWVENQAQQQQALQHTLERLAEQREAGRPDRQGEHSGGEEPRLPLTEVRGER